MKDSYRTFARTQVSTFWQKSPPYSFTSTQTVANSKIDQFSFTGFGYNDPKKRRLPSSGSYVKDVYDTGEVTDVQLDGRVSAGLESSVTRTGGNLYCGWPGLISLRNRSFSPTVYNEALSKLYEEIRQTEVNLAVTLGEARETRRMLAALGGIIHYARQARRKVLRNPSLLISEAWLGYKYGWQPLYNDIFNYLEHTQRYFDSVEFRARRTQSYPVNSVISTTPDTFRARGSITERCEFKVRCKVDDPLAFDLSRVTSFNPLLIAWELTPLSFAVDWLVDVGGYLQNMEAALNRTLVFEHGYVTRLLIFKATETVSRETYTAAGGYWTQRSVYGTGSLYRVVKERSKLTSFPLPYLPRLEVKMGWQRILSATALVRTILLGRAR